MKSLKFAIAALCLVMTGQQIMNAQERENRDADNKIVRGPYVTNDAGSNWFVGAGAGITVFGDGGIGARVTPALDITFGKWLTPSVGIRAGYQGLTGALWSPEPTVIAPEVVPGKNMYSAKFGYAYLHADFLWNISDCFSGYRADRFWNVIPYAHAGLLRTYKVSEGFGDNELAMGAGLYNTMRISDRVDLTLDLRGLLVNGRQHMSSGVSGELSLTFGVAVNLGKTGWKRSSDSRNAADAQRLTALEAQNSVLEAEKKALAEEKAALESENAKLESEKSDLSDENTGLKADNEKLENKNELLEVENDYLRSLNSNKPSTRQAFVPRPDSFYFGIGQTTLSVSEQQRLDAYLQNELSRMEKDQKVVIRASADSSTGTAERNAYLTSKRVEFIKNLLVNKYNLDIRNFEFRSEVVDSDEPELARAIGISFK